MSYWGSVSSINWGQEDPKLDVFGHILGRKSVTQVTSSGRVRATKPTPLIFIRRPCSTTVPSISCQHTVYLLIPWFQWPRNASTFPSLVAQFEVQATGRWICVRPSPPVFWEAAFRESLCGLVKELTCHFQSFSGSGERQVLWAQGEIRLKSSSHLNTALEHLSSLLLG